jgi:nitroreductase
MSLDSIIQKRKSVKGFSEKKADWRKIIKAIDAARYAPMAGNIFTLKFILVDNKDKIKKISDACQQNFIKEASQVIVVCSKPLLAKIPFPEQGETFLHQQAGAGIQNILLKLEEQGLAACWVGYFVENLVREELDISSEVSIEAIIPVGHETKSKVIKKTKTDLEASLYFNSYGDKRMKPI